VIKEVLLQELGEGIHSVEVSEVRVKPGDHIKKDDVILVAETEKASMEIPSTTTGIVKKVLVKISDEVEPGSVLVTVEAVEGEDSKVDPEKSAPEPETTESKPPKKSEVPEKSTAEPEATDSEPKVPETATVEAPASPQDPPPSAPPVKSISTAPPLASPAIRKFGRELGVDLDRVTGTGPKGRILKPDVDAYIKMQVQRAQSGLLTGISKPKMPEIDFSQWGEIERIGLNKIRRITGETLQQSWQTVPHVTQYDEADITELESFRKEQNSLNSGDSGKLTLLPFIMKAVVAALKAFPDANASLDSTGENLILKKYFHLGIAVDTPQGLVVPVIRNVEQKSLRELSAELADVSERTRSRKITPAELKGASFTISSLGGIGGTWFSPIVNTPEVGILGVSRAAMKPVFQENGEFVPRLILPFSLSYDHRVIDGAAGVRFTQFVSGMLSDIRQLLL